MEERKLADPRSGDAAPVMTYTIYAAGGLFTQHELAGNICLKEAVWRLSKGKFELFLPQSRELQELDRPEVEAYIRNDDLLHVVEADMLLVCFDGLELDSGTVVEFITAKFLGKPTVILRSDFRRQSGTGLSEPYNLMEMNWPRNVSVHMQSYQLWVGIFAEARGGLDDRADFQAMMQAELDTSQKSVDQIALEVIAGFEEVLKMESPYPPEYQELVYEVARMSPGSGFDQMLTESKADKIIRRLRENGTL